MKVYLRAVHAGQSMSNHHTELEIFCSNCGVIKPLVEFYPADVRPRIPCDQINVLSLLGFIAEYVKAHNSCDQDASPPLRRAFTPVPEPVAPITVIACPAIALAGEWRCIKPMGHDGAHDFGETNFFPLGDG